MFEWVPDALSYIGRQLLNLFISGKALLVAVITGVALPSLWNMALEWLETMVTWGLDRLDSVVLPGVPTGLLLDWTGQLGWIANCLRLPECISLVAAWLTVKFMLRLLGSFLPGVRVVN